MFISLILKKLIKVLFNLIFFSINYFKRKVLNDPKTLTQKVFQDSFVIYIYIYIFLFLQNSGGTMNVTVVGTDRKKSCVHFIFEMILGSKLCAK